MVLPSITIIGTGSLGGALLNFFEAEEYPIHSLWNSEGGLIRDEISGALRPGDSLFPEKESEIGDWVFITTPDHAISSTAQKLARIPLDWSAKTIIHCSGNISSNGCSILADAGAKAVSMHPVQTFRKGDGRDRFRHIHVTLEGNKDGIEQLVTVVKKMGAIAVLLNSTQKQFVHIAAVFASNYLVALLGYADRLLKEEGIEDGLDIVKPLVNQTLANLFDKGIHESLTGPIARGDENTVQSHLHILEKGSGREQLYRVLGREALQIALENGNLSDEQVVRLKNLLDHGWSI